MESISDIMARILKESVKSDGECRFCACRGWHKMNCIVKDLEKQVEITPEFIGHISAQSGFDGFMGESVHCNFCNENDHKHKDGCVIKDLEDFEESEKIMDKILERILNRSN